MPERSAGILLFQRNGENIRVLLIHPGGPYWTKRDAGAWMIHKGGINPGEEPLADALREFEEELGTRPNGTAIDLGEVRQKGGKIVRTFAMEADFDVGSLKSNNFSLEWPPRSGIISQFPEVDQAEWFTLSDAYAAILPSQQPFLWRLQETIGHQKEKP